MVEELGIRECSSKRIASQIVTISSRIIATFGKAWLNVSENRDYVVNEFFYSFTREHNLTHTCKCVSVRVDEGG